MLFLAGALAIFVYGMIAAMLGTILPGLTSRFQLTPKQNGTIAFAQALGLMIASLLVGPLLDHEGKKLGLVLGPDPGSHRSARSCRAPAGLAASRPCYSYSGWEAAWW
ncbi:MAG: hypothetical protein WDO73_25590 [Ignavibacteriota bacterium]